jgi:hypothetical protein
VPSARGVSASSVLGEDVLLDKRVLALLDFRVVVSRLSLATL